MNLTLNSPFVDTESVDPGNSLDQESFDTLPSFERDVNEDRYPYNMEDSEGPSDTFRDEEYADSPTDRQENQDDSSGRFSWDEYSNDETPMQVLEHFEVPVHASGMAPVLSVALNARATKANKKSLTSSGVSLKDIYTALRRSVDISLVTSTLAAGNKKDSNKGSYLIEGEGAIDAVFTEVVHQFQTVNYLNPAEHDGIAGRSVLETLGFLNHKLKGSLNTASLYGQIQLNKIKEQVARDTADEFISATWFDGLVKPSWLGVKIGDGIHVLLLRKLKEAEAWLLAQPKYAGMTPVALGTALGFTAQTRYSGARLSKDGAGMHSVGLALDIDARGNPWIGAGWIMNDPVKKQERTRFLETLRKASGERLPGTTIFNYLDSLAKSLGTDTQKVVEVLKEKNDQFVQYLRTHPDELKYWTSSATFQHQSPLKGFMTLHPDLVYALRHIAGLAWGAIDFGPNASGDIMHFDMRTIGVGKNIATQIRAHVPSTGHPTLDKEFLDETAGALEEWQHDYDLEQPDDVDHHEAVEELTWD